MHLERLLLFGFLAFRYIPTSAFPVPGLGSVIIPEHIKDHSSISESSGSSDSSSILGNSDQFGLDERFNTFVRRGLWTDTKNGITHLWDKASGTPKPPATHTRLNSIDNQHTGASQDNGLRNEAPSGESECSKGKNKWYDCLKPSKETKNHTPAPGHDQLNGGDYVNRSYSAKVDSAPANRRTDQDRARLGYQPSSSPFPNQPSGGRKLVSKNNNGRAAEKGPWYNPWHRSSKSPQKNVAPAVAAAHDVVSSGYNPNEPSNAISRKTLLKAPQSGVPASDGGTTPAYAPKYVIYEAPPTEPVELASTTSASKPSGFNENKIPEDLNEFAEKGFGSFEGVEVFNPNLGKDSFPKFVPKRTRPIGRPRIPPDLFIPPSPPSGKVNEPVLLMDSPNFLDRGSSVRPNDIIRSPRSGHLVDPHSAGNNLSRRPIYPNPRGPSVRRDSLPLSC